MNSKIKSFFNLFSSDYLDERTKFNARIAMLTNFIWSVLKILFGLWKSSYFFCLSGVYTLLMGVCKYIYLKGYKKYKGNTEKELPYYKAISIILIIASFSYILYMGKLFMWPEHKSSYGLIPSIAIALVATVEVFFSIRGFFKMKQKQEILLMAIKCISIVSALTNVVLTQVCLLEACSTEVSDIEKIPMYNAISGVSFGLICLLIGIAMLLNIKKITKAS